MSQMKIFSESSFFKKQRAVLPTPAEVRAINLKTNNRYASDFHRPTPVKIPSLGLLVKYGAYINLVEAETQIMLRERLYGRVPVPAIFGWAQDGKQTFIYMELIEGDTLLDRWDSLTEEELRSICEDLHHLIETIRTLEQDSCDRYVGSLGKQPLNDWIIEDRPDVRGPFHGANTVQQFHDCCQMEIDNMTPIVFTHNDLLPPNIIITRGPNPKVAAIIDWAQAGWYPAYWEYCKAVWTEIHRDYFSDAQIEEWRMKYLPIVLNPVDSESCLYPWIYFVLSKL
ncbi:kinase-like domain-containing protein [Aspergillus coremiiformis]|uniref:Kinase-like domain-containing protein n=1 Tax=Aspergillus coremiiformis TaxID=138285 RepID=A0A5N6Z2L6_9EURO|nr:kinase-like domain-containing protein [Aspergillus coremiiformis]